MWLLLNTVYFQEYWDKAEIKSVAENTVYP